MIEETAESGLALVFRRLGETIKAAKEDGGKTYDRMAERIRSNAAEGLVAEALGYVPAEAEELSAQDVFRPRKKIGRPRSGPNRISPEMKNKILDDNSGI